MAYPVSTHDFVAIASGNFKFVDKSLIIKDIVESGKGAFLFTRPRRFGKTMNLNMLDAFFDCDRDNSHELFSGLKISEVPGAMEHLGRYKVIHLDFSQMESGNKRSFYAKISLMLSELFEKYHEISNSPHLKVSEQKRFLEIENGTEDTALMIRAIPLLCRWINTVYGRETVILIDEYDKPA